MLGFIAATLFIIAFLINATSAATNAVFSPTSLLLRTGPPRPASRGHWHERGSSRPAGPPLTGVLQRVRLG